MNSIKRAMQSIFYNKRKMFFLTVLYFSMFYLLIIIAIAAISSERQVENMTHSIGNSIMVEKTGSNDLFRNLKAGFTFDEIQVLSNDAFVLSHNAFVYGEGTMTSIEPIIKDKARYLNYKEKLLDLGIELDNAAFIGVTDSNRSSFFAGAGYYMVQGNTIDKGDIGKPVALISKQLAQHNDITIGDIVILSGAKDSYSSKAELQVEIKGIYSFPDQSYQDSKIFTPVDLSENQIFLPQDILTTFEPNYYQPKQVFVYLSNVTMLDQYIHKMEKLLGESVYDTTHFTEVRYTYNTDKDWHEMISLPLKEMSRAAKVMSIIIASGIYLIVLLICAWLLRGKRGEMGICISMGEQKRSILLQTLIELLSPILCGLIFAYILGIVSTPYVSDYIISDSSTQINQEIDARRIMNTYDKGLGDGYYVNFDIQDGDFNFYQATTRLYFSQCEDTFITITLYGVLSVSLSVSFQVIYVLKRSPRVLLTAKR